MKAPHRLSSTLFLVDGARKELSGGSPQMSKTQRAKGVRRRNAARDAGSGPAFRRISVCPCSRRPSIEVALSRLGGCFIFHKSLT